MKKKAIVVLANGFEEVEAATPIDVLRRAGIDVIVAGLEDDTVTGAHGMMFKTDTVLEKIKTLPDAVIFPGGMPGAENLARSSKVKDMILAMDSGKKLIAAICASPALVLAPLGVLDGKKATCYPGMDENFSAKVKCAKEKVVQDGNVITSRGPGTAFDFSLKIAENLAGKETADMVGKQMLYSA
ncbi:MAG: DJ-1 family glyoxalase III [Candidatus Omnitrophota bacterium]